MAEKTMREVRDDIAQKAFGLLFDIHMQQHHCCSDDELKVLAADAFKVAEAFLAARYDADNRKHADGR